jgi:hypothetical protein
MSSWRWQRGKYLEFSHETQIEVLVFGFGRSSSGGGYEVTVKSR